jgi:hypothetical protein
LGASDSEGGMTATTKRMGIFDSVSEATHPGPELPRAPRKMRGKIEIVIGALPDPNPIEGEKLKRQRVAMNVAKDVLLRELQHGRIGNAQFAVGRVYEAILEAAAVGAGGSSFELSSGRGDHEAMIAKVIDRAGGVVEADHSIRGLCGERGASILREVLGDRRTFKQIAAALRLPQKRGPGRIAIEFREALQALAKEWAAI